ncbi:MAG: caspase family protein [Treponema sp.]|jgi:uncharacterized caspase-like protein|nr:caspase family protein [Treponema sp.]
MKKSLTVFYFLIIIPALWAQQKYALVIGNGNYFGISRLSKPETDANDIAATLQSQGFAVDKVLNGTLSQMERGVASLKQKLSSSRNSNGFFYYTGHGAQSGGENYLIPVDAITITNDSQLRQRSLSVRILLDNLKGAGNEFNTVILDACRNNPFYWMTGRSDGRGLAAINAPAGFVIMYSAGANQASADGNERNSLFAGQLLSNLKTPDISLHAVFAKTEEDVIKASEGKQRPALSYAYNDLLTAAYETAPAPVSAAQVIAFGTGSIAGRADPDAANWDIAALDTARNADYLSPVEKDVVLEMNKVRTNPIKYMELYLQPRLKYYNKKNYSVPGQITILTAEGAAAVNDCINALSRAPSAGVLNPEKGLALAAKDHVIDQGGTGHTGHIGSDRSAPDARMKRYGNFYGSWSWGENIAYGEASGRDIVCGLLIDDGVPSRDHRITMMKAAFSQTGAAFGTHKQYRTSCVIEYANGYRSN